MRVFFFIFLSFLLKTSLSFSAEMQPNISTDTIDRLMFLRASVPDGWSLVSPSDEAFSVNETYKTVYKQDFNSFTFGKNAAALVGLRRAGGDLQKIKEAALYLHQKAQKYTRSYSDCRFIINDFPFEYLNTYFKKGFRGAFMNNVTAYAYMHLFTATDNRIYLDEAEELLKATAFCDNEEVKLHSLDNNGYYWLNEYVFKIADKDERLFSTLGMEKNENGWWRARVYNGHIHALLAFMKYRELTESNQFDDVIEKSIATMVHYLPLQIYRDQYFSYTADIGRFPDYGQLRAVILAEGLCNLTERPDLCRSSQQMRVFYEERVKGHDEALYKVGMKSMSKYIRAWRKIDCLVGRC